MEPQAAGGFGIVFLVLMFVIAALSLAALAFWVYALIDAVQNQSLTSNERMIWIIVILFTNWVGALLYLLIGKNKGGQMKL